ncbi:ATP-binding protein [Amycolatopsis albispora]|uniref:Histidine kinase/HSP90-like ATPase domain-containing protein n=1 Tax=Amycolatopsis albispora TaxID=1804986 RepID=A0A344L0P4_9PSEU|nr:ATP-binding protein [Amycolatopsis albispora]AXB41618.1 hypothetical protein A4R43_03015 [Amycolatopsis albispora]
MAMESRDTARGDPQETRCDLDEVPLRHVRGLVREVLAGRDGLEVDDAVLVADELVSNAHQHGKAPRACRLVLTGEGRLRIEVDDAGPGQPKMRTPDRTGGRGLRMVNRLASAWGVERYPGHKTVWAELALDGVDGTGHARHLTIAPN